MKRLRFSTIRLYLSLVTRPALIAVLLSFSSLGVWAQMPGRCELPIGERKGDIGCYVLESKPVGRLPAGDLFWHIYVVPNRAAAEAVKAPYPTIVVAFDKTWLFSLAPRDWTPSSGERVSVIGPLPHSTERSYTARYLEAVITPGERTPVHTHAGPEAWYLVAGSECLETPEGIMVAHAGDSAVVKEGLPMMLSSVGTATRNAFALILHDSSQPWTMPMPSNGWKPAGRCPK
jgi:quercetin dioxygenase-like cupin family protein